MSVSTFDQFPNGSRIAASEVRVVGCVVGREVFEHPTITMKRDKGKGTSDKG
jgi:hypothetical protein